MASITTLNKDDLRQGLFIELYSWLHRYCWRHAGLRLNLLWFRPQTGNLCFGPLQLEDMNFLGRINRRYLREGLTTGYAPRDLNFSPCFSDPRSLPTSNYRDFPGYNLEFSSLPRNAGSQDLFNYLICNFPDRKLLSAACWNSSFTHGTHSLTPGGLAYEDARTNKTLLIGGGLSSERVLALPFHQWVQSVYNDYCAEEADYEVMENGEMRFLIEKTADGYNSHSFCSKQYEGSPATREGEHWLPQAGQIFTHYEISRSEWESCRFITEITLSLRGPYGQQGRNNTTKLDPPCYLFILPLPQCPDSTPDIETWLRGENLYYYSYNPKGGSAITVEECILLGLPPLTADVDASYLQWDNNAYDFMEEWQKAKGFDYTTADYAKSLGIPDLLARPQEERHFEDLTDSPDVLEADLMDVDSNEVTRTRETRAPSGLSEEVEDDQMDVD
ncbi:hypothetical protein PQX77_013566 [Marasmius sp. AFHP31]|nr:hypothetical protein PQX77_013566 [Marasmius sp. AFHP31]